MMNGREKSDSAVVAMKPANKAGEPAAEQVSQGRGPRGTRVSHTRTGRSTGQACHRGWNVYGKLQDSGRRSGSPRFYTTSRSTDFGWHSLRSNAMRLPEWMA